MSYEIVLALGFCPMALYCLIHHILIPILGSQRARELVRSRSIVTIIPHLPILFNYFVLRRLPVQEDNDGDEGGQDGGVEEPQADQQDADGSAFLYRECILIWLYLAIDCLVAYPLIAYCFLPGYVQSVSLVQFWLLFAPYMAATLFNSTLSGLVEKVLLLGGDLNLPVREMGSEQLRLTVMGKLPCTLRLALSLSLLFSIVTLMPICVMLLSDVHTSAMVRICAIHTIFTQLFNIFDKSHAWLKSASLPTSSLPMPTFLQLARDVCIHFKYYPIREVTHRFGHVLSDQASILLVTHLCWRVLQSASWLAVLIVQSLRPSSLAEGGTMNINGSGSEGIGLAYFNYALIAEFALFACSLLYQLYKGIEGCCIPHARDSLIYSRIELISRPATAEELRNYIPRVCCVCEEAMWFGTVLFHDHCHHICHSRCIVEATKGDSKADISCPQCQVLLDPPEAQQQPLPPANYQLQEENDEDRVADRGGLRKRLKHAWKSVTGGRRNSSTSNNNEIWV